MELKKTKILRFSFETKQVLTPGQGSARVLFLRTLAAQDPTLCEDPERMGPALASGRLSQRHL